jgi:hypothetical protein
MTDSSVAITRACTRCITAITRIDDPIGPPVLDNLLFRRAQHEPPPLLRGAGVAVAAGALKTPAGK